MTTIWFEQALLPAGWSERVRVSIADGLIARVEADVDAAPDDARHWTGLPGLPNLHSHAFQRAMAGLAEARGAGGQDDFWSWRTAMYALVATLTPDDVATIAAMAQVEMMEAGFTRVGEFHYLHHAPDGRPYDDRAAMAAALAAAATESGIGLTLLPVFYAHSDFGGAAPNAGQARFINDLDGFAALVDASRAALSGLDAAVVGVAPHSLRAVTPDELRVLQDMPGPVHIHIAEQTREVEACVAWSGQRPVAWLLDHADVDARWCLVHATHVDAAEVTGMARSGAVMGLCPITEANLGDGVFPAADWRGPFGVGSDSNVRIDAAEELRLLEYGQRLIRRQRNVLAGERSTGTTMFAGAVAGGAQALGIDGGIVVGAPADLIALRRDDTPAMGDAAIDRWVFARGGSAIDGVWRGGRQYVADGRHVARDAVTARYAQCMARVHAASAG